MKESDIGYMERTRLYYRAQGYTQDYRWAHYDDVPFTAPAKPLAASRVAIVTTAMEVTDADRGSVMLLDPVENVLTIKAAKGR